MMIVREATQADVPAIARVHVDTWRSTYQGIMPDELLANLSYAKREQGWYAILNNAATNHSFFIYVAEQSSQIVGFACGGVERTGDAVYRGELTAIYILKCHQQKGIGRKLVRAVAQKLNQMNIQTMLVWVLAENPACRFYEMLGGRKIYEKEIETGGTKLIEIAYGWTTLSDLKFDRTS